MTTVDRLTTRLAFSRWQSPQPQPIGPGHSSTRHRAAHHACDRAATHAASACAASRAANSARNRGRPPMGVGAQSDGGAAVAERALNRPCGSTGKLLDWANDPAVAAPGH